MNPSTPQPNFSFESRLWQKGICLVAGADEVGRGAFAGPVMAAVVALPRNIKLEVEINDSKKLSSQKREIACSWIKKNALVWAVGQGTVSEINRLGIVKATHRAFRRAIANQKLSITNLLIDAFYIPYLNGIPQTNQIPIKKGDSLSISIAAASIIAKVHRDSYMTKLSQNYQVYAWHQNKGYGTLSHRQAIQKHGPTSHHRSLYLRSLFSSPAQSDT